MHISAVAHLSYQTIRAGGLQYQAQTPFTCFGAAVERSTDSKCDSGGQAGRLIQAFFCSFWKHVNLQAIS
jgi:hypothetical protein